MTLAASILGIEIASVPPSLGITPRAGAGCPRAAYHSPENTWARPRFPRGSEPYPDVCSRRGLGALEDAADIDADLAIRIRQARSIADQPADFGM
jgi:hypothetical protein